MKKFLMMLLVLAMLATVLAGCAEQGEDPEDTTEATDTQADTEQLVDEWGRDFIADNLPRELDFGKEEVKILIRSGGQYDREWFKENIEDSLDQAIYERNAYVEEELNVILTFVPLACDLSGANDTQAYNAKILNDYNGQLGSYDIVNNFAYYGITQQLTAIYANMMDTEVFPHFEFDKPWWNQKYLDTVAIGGKTQFAVGSVCLSLLDRTFVMYYNETLGESYGLSGLYDTVLAGNWTYAELYELCNTYYTDVDNLGGENEADFYVMAAKRYAESWDPYLYAFDQRLVQTKSDGTHLLYTEGFESLDAAAKKVKALFDTKGAYIHADSYKVIEMFANDQLLFAQQAIWHYPSHSAVYRDMTSEFGIVPIPKLDETQEEYLSGVGDCYNILSIPNYNDLDGEMLSAVLELMNIESYRDVYPYYYEKIMKLQYVNNSVSSQIFDMIVANISFDPGDVFACYLKDLKQTFWRNPCDTGIPVTRVNATSGATVSELIVELDDWLLGR